MFEQEQYPIYFDEQKQMCWPARIRGQSRTISLDELPNCKEPDPGHPLFVPIYMVEVQNPRCVEWDLGELFRVFPNARATSIDKHVRNLEVLENLKNLFELRIGGPLHRNEALNLGALKNLMKLRIGSEPDDVFRFENISNFESESLRSLTLFRTNYDERDLQLLRSFKELRSLELVWEKINSLNGIEVFSKLFNLSLGYLNRLSDISALSAPKLQLKCLEIEACSKIEDLSPISNLTDIRQLDLDKVCNLDNLSLLDDLKELRGFRLMNTIVLDGKMSRLRQLPHLQFAVFQNRKHYDLKSNDLIYESR